MLVCVNLQSTTFRRRVWLPKCREHLTTQHSIHLWRPDYLFQAFGRLIAERTVACDMAPLLYLSFLCVAGTFDPCSMCPGRNINHSSIVSYWSVWQTIELYAVCHFVQYDHDRRDLSRLTVTDRSFPNSPPYSRLHVFSYFTPEFIYLKWTFLEKSEVTFVSDCKETRVEEFFFWS
jgi:hypothetical protein